MAGLWKLPCVFVCQDNNYGISVNKANSTAVASVADRAASYGMPGVVYDRGSRGAQAYISFGAEMIERVKKDLK